MALLIYRGQLSAQVQFVEYRAIQETCLALHSAASGTLTLGAMRLGGPSMTANPPSAVKDESELPDRRVRRHHARGDQRPRVMREHVGARGLADARGAVVVAGERAHFCGRGVDVAGFEQRAARVSDVL